VGYENSASPPHHRTPARTPAYPAHATSVKMSKIIQYYFITHFCTAQPRCQPLRVEHCQVLSLTRSHPRSCPIPPPICAKICCAASTLLVHNGMQEGATPRAHPFVAIPSARAAPFSFASGPPPFTGSPHTHPSCSQVALPPGLCPLLLRAAPHPLALTFACTQHAGDTPRTVRPFHSRKSPTGWSELQR
jgi:hypothetical protein